MDKDTENSLKALSKLILGDSNKPLTLNDVKKFVKLLDNENNLHEDIVEAAKVPIPTKFPLYSESIYVGQYKDKVV